MSHSKSHTITLKTLYGHELAAELDNYASVRDYQLNRATVDRLCQAAAEIRSLTNKCNDLMKVVESYQRWARQCPIIDDALAGQSWRR